MRSTTPADGLTSPDQPQTPPPGPPAPRVIREWPLSVRIALVGLFLIASFHTIYFAAPVLVPMTVAVLLSVLLAPIVDRLEAVGLPRGVASGLIVIAALALIITAIAQLVAPAQDWITRVPSGFSRVEEHLKFLRKPIQEIQKATERIENAAELEQRPQRRQVVELRRPSFAGELLSGTPRVFSAVGIVIVLLFFLLATGDLFLRKLIAIMPTDENKSRVVDIAQSVKKDISFYLLTLTLMNIGFGIVVGSLAWYLRVESPLLWGALTAVLSFAPYVGPAVIAVVLSMAALISVNQIAPALILTGTYLGMLVFMQNVISPHIWGRRLALNPVAIFVSIIFWGWLWGVPGALLAVPLLSSFKIVAERVRALRPAAEFLSP